MLADEDGETAAHLIKNLHSEVESLKKELNLSETGIQRLNNQ